MTTIAPPRPTEVPGLPGLPGLPGFPVRLTAGPATVAAARGQVRAAIDLWRAPVDPDVAVLLASDLVTNAVRHQHGGTITLGVRCAPGQLRVDVHGGAIGPDLILVRTLSEDWGCYPTPAGQAVYFTLAFGPGPGGGDV
ncbi:MAG TPA: ATP-binding protein [Streptosporangiaceae bacterium]|nr:ATP-binding protein [Streptosporangiaceae bacterium]